jgi:hypothetical protein
VDLIPPTTSTHGTNIERNEVKLEPIQRSFTEDSTKHSKRRSSQGEPGNIKIPALKAWEGSRLQMVGLDALLSYKTVVAWCPGPVDDTKHYFQQLHKLNQGLDTNHWRVFEHREEPNGVHHVLSIDFPSVTALGKREW